MFDSQKMMIEGITRSWKEESNFCFR